MNSVQSCSNFIPEKGTLAQLKSWLIERGAPTKGNKSDLVSRVNACIKYGWTNASTKEPEVTDPPAQKCIYPDRGWIPILPFFSRDKDIDDPTDPRFTMSTIMSYFVTRFLKDSLPAGDFKSISKSAENLFRCGHVQDIGVATITDKVYIKSKCLPEMRKDRLYCVCMCLNRNNYDILSAECGCPAGCGPCGSCKHIGALSYALADFFRIKDAPESLTCTDQLQQWNRPRGRKVHPIPVEKLGDRRRELLPSKIRGKGSQMVYDPRPQHTRKVDKLALEALRCELLCINKPCALLNLLVPSFDKIANDHTYCLKPGSVRLCDDSVKFCDSADVPKVFVTERVTAEDILDKLSVSKKQQEDLEMKTRDQSSSTLWIAERQSRITGSKCGRILQQVKKTPALLQCTIYYKPFVHIPKAIRWGTDHEENARIEYEKYMRSNDHVGLHTKKAGFVVDSDKIMLARCVP